MSDLALAGGIGQGLLSFADTYMKQQQLNKQNEISQQYADMAKQNSQAGLLSKGMEVSPTGSVQYNPAMQSQIEAENKQKADLNDPESDISKSTKDFYDARLKKAVPGFPGVPEGKPANYYHQMYGSFLPEQEKLTGQENVAQIKAKAELGAANARVQGQETVAGMRNAGKSTSDQNKAFSEMVGKTESFRGNKAVANAADALRSVGNAQELISQYPDLNKMPQAQVNLLNDELAKIAGGGAATEGGRKELSSATFESRLQDFKARVGNAPTGAELGEFLKQNIQYLGGLQKANEKIVNDYRKNIYSAYEDRISDAHKQKFKTEMHPEMFREQSNAGGGLLNQKPETASNHPEASSALAWAQNPKSPGWTKEKADAILQRLGVAQTAGR